MDIGPARYWREIPQRYRYEAAKCSGCGKIYFPPRLVCGKCRRTKFEKATLARTGEIETFTVIRVAPHAFSDQIPYAIGIIRLDDGAQVTAQIVDCETDSLKIGDRVRLEFRKIQQDGDSGILCYGYKFVPAS